MKLVEYFDRIYIIFLPERTDRVRQIEHQLTKLGLDNSKVIWFPGLKYTDAAGFPKPSVRGCAMSHYTVLSQAAEAGVERLLVLEDDCTFSRRLIRNEQDIVNELATTHWDFAYLGHGAKIARTQQSKTYFIKAALAQPISLTHFCAYQKRAIPRLLNLIANSLNQPPGHPDGGPMGFDGYRNFFRTHNPDTVTLIASPSLGGQYSSASNLNPGILDRYKPIAPLLKVARVAKNTIQSFS